MKRRKPFVPRTVEQMVQCGNKVQHATHADAFAAAKIVVKRRGGDLSRVSAYHCPHCGSYHWGNRRQDK